ncbi:hypothetical protein KSF_083150 [Reticulibacter mediterranei]|uniref:CBU-0592-like domain-containing protein n=1 Tax=Reticulibacter mediterranei TaxID=2778369 RepID=A0A8J3N8H7_9CHLR|nr:hypothetical protein [Reticulibacter mediterranei]GHO98267.1 hypothetical protein KSF_083150 [Reticulibacter mediterranei]
MHMGEILQTVGALMVLGGFALSQFRILSQHSYLYLLLNVIGSGILAVLAALQLQWGFLLLEGGWSLVAFWGIITRISGRTSFSSH